MDLALDDHRIDLRAAVVDGDEPTDLHLGGAGVDVDDADVGAERIGEVGGVVADLSFEASLDPLRQIAGAVCLHGDVLDRHRLLRVALDAEASCLVLDVGDACLQHARGDDLGLVPHLAGHECSSRTRHRCRARAIRAETEWSVVGVAMHDVDVFGRDADLLGDDLGERCLVPLPLGLDRESDDGLPGRVDAEFAPVGHAETEDVHVLAWAGTDRLGEERDADAHQLTALALLGLLSRSSS